MKRLDVRANYPRLCLVGPFVGRNPGNVTTQGEILTDKFKQTGYPVISVSEHSNRFVRLLDIIVTLIRFRRHVDILILQVYGERSFVVEDIASYLSKKFGHRVIGILRGGTLPQFMKRFPHWSKRVLQRADSLIAPSNFLASAISGYGLQAQIIPNVIDISHYSYRHRKTIKPNLFWMRSFYYYYNPLMAVRVLARLINRYPEARLVMAGRDKGEEGKVRQLVEKHGLEKNVTFAGFLNMEAKVQELTHGDIYLNTNSIDNMPVSVVEACASGLPVVATAVGGIPNLLTNGESALLVPNNDDKAMANAVISLLEDPSLVAKLSSNGRELAEQSSWENVHFQFQQIFSELLRRNR